MTHGGRSEAGHNLGPAGPVARRAAGNPAAGAALIHGEQSPAVSPNAPDAATWQSMLASLGVRIAGQSEQDPAEADGELSLDEPVEEPGRSQEAVIDQKETTRPQGKTTPVSSSGREEAGNRQTIRAAVESLASFPPLTVLSRVPVLSAPFTGQTSLNGTRTVHVDKPSAGAVGAKRSPHPETSSPSQDASIAASITAVRPIGKMVAKLASPAVGTPTTPALKVPVAKEAYFDLPRQVNLVARSASFEEKTPASPAVEGMAIGVAGISQMPLSGSLPRPALTVQWASTEQWAPARKDVASQNGNDGAIAGRKLPTADRTYAPSQSPDLQAWTVTDTGAQSAGIESKSRTPDSPAAPAHRDMAIRDAGGSAEPLRGSPSHQASAEQWAPAQTGWASQSGNEGAIDRQDPSNSDRTYAPSQPPEFHGGAVNYIRAQSGGFENQGRTPDSPAAPAHQVVAIRDASGSAAHLRSSPSHQASAEQWAPAQKVGTSQIGNEGAIDRQNPSTRDRTYAHSQPSELQTGTITYIGAQSGVFENKGHTPDSPEVPSHQVVAIRDAIGSAAPLRSSLSHQDSAGLGVSAQTDRASQFGSEGAMDRQKPFTPDRANFTSQPSDAHTGTIAGSGSQFGGVENQGRTPDSQAQGDARDHSLDYTRGDARDNGQDNGAAQTSADYGGTNDGGANPLNPAGKTAANSAQPAGVIAERTAPEADLQDTAQAAPRSSDVSSVGETGGNRSRRVQPQTGLSAAPVAGLSLNPAGAADSAAPSLTAVPANVPVGDANRASAPSTFSALDAEAAPGAPTWIHASAQRAEVGYQDPALGWVSVRADSSGGTIHAALVPGSAEAAQTLGGHMEGLNAYLSEHHTPVETLTLAPPENRAGDTRGFDSPAGSQNMPQGGGHGSGHSTGQGAGQDSEQDSRRGAGGQDQTVREMSRDGIATATPGARVPSQAGILEAIVPGTATAGRHISVVA